MTYSIGTSNSATVMVNDDDSLPVLTITGPTTPVAESTGSIDFVINTNKELGEDVRIRYQASEVLTGDFLNENATPSSQEAIAWQTVDFSGSAGSYSATLSVPIHNDLIGERTGQISVTLLSDDSATQKYTVPTSNRKTAQTIIWDDDAPELKISAGSPVLEGNGSTANFIITSEFYIPSLTVNYTPTSTNYLQTGSGVATSALVNFSSSSPFTATLPIAIHDDDVVESDGTIQVSLNEESTPLTTYAVAASPNNSAATTVTDDDSIPLLSISAPTTPILESAGEADYTISSAINPGTNFRVRFKPSEVAGGDFLDAGPTPINQEAITSQNVDFSGSGRSYTATLTVPIHNDAVAEHTGQIEVALIADDAAVPTYRVAPNTDPAGRRTTIKDDDVPELSISGSGTLTEGDGNMAEFTITSQLPVPNNSITIFYTPLSPNFLQTGSGVQTSQKFVFAGAGPYTTTLSFAVHDDEVSESNGAISVTLNEESVPATNYTVASAPNNAAAISITDDDSLPLLNISAPTSPIIESAGSINFVVATTIDLGSNFRVRYQPSEVGTGDFLNESATPTSQEALTEAQLSFSGSSGYYAATLSVPIHNDTVGERTGHIDVTLIADDAVVKTYQIGSDGSQTARATILDDDAPELRISASGTITEGDGNTAGYTITSKVPVSSLAVFYTPESADFLESGSGVRTFTTLNFTGDGPYTAPLTISVHDDNVEEDNGTINVTLNEENTPGTSYTVMGAPDNTASINVTDDDSLPLLTLSALTAPDDEGDGFLNFEIASPTNLGDSFRVRYQASEVNTGDFLDETATPSQLEIGTANVAFSRRFITFYATLPVPIHNDDVGEPTGQVMVTLIEDDEASRTYRIATDGSQTAIGTILDDDAPVLKISAGANVTEGDGNTADFTIASDVLVHSLTVHYNLHTSNFLEFGSGTDTFARLNFSGNGPYTAPLNLTVHDDNVKEDDGTIGVTLLDESTPGTSYYVAAAPENTAELTVLDNDVPPRISVAADNGSVAENTGPAMFTLSTTGLTADTTLMINATPIDVGGTFVANSSARNFSVMFTDPDNDNTYTGNLAVPLTTDQIGEPTGQIKLTLNTDTAQTKTYQLGYNDRRVYHEYMMMTRPN